MFTRFLVNLVRRHGGVCSTGTRLCCVQSPLNLPQQPKLMVSLLYLGDRIHSVMFKLENLLIFVESSDASNGTKTVRRTTFPKEVEVCSFAFPLEILTMC